MIDKIFRLAAATCVILTVASIFVAISASNSLLKSAHPTTPTLEATIPLSVRGAGTVYLTNAEWGSVSVYWNSFYVFLSLAVVSLLAALVLQGYRGFVSGWQKSNKGD
jgi:hypothetical protein